MYWVSGFLGSVLHVLGKNFILVPWFELILIQFFTQNPSNDFIRQ